MTDSDITDQIQQWKQRVPPLSVAEQVGEVRRSGSTFMMHCPFHDDRTPSMAVYDDGFHCHACRWHGDSVDFIMEVNGWTWTEFIDFIAGFQVDPRPVRHVQRKAQTKRERPQLDSQEIEHYALNMGSREWAYWRKQNISAATLGRFGVGWNGRRYTIPWYYRDVLMAVKMRRDDDLHPTMEPKYISMTGSRYAVPYNIDGILYGTPETLLIVEDEKSVWVASQLGYTAISAPAGAWKQDWSRMLAHILNIVIIADWDESGIGQSAAMNIHRQLRRSRVEMARGFFPDGRQVNDLHDMAMAGLNIKEVFGL